MSLISNIRNVLSDTDYRISYQVFSLARKFNGNLKSYFKFLEWSCHGVPWILFVTILVYTSSSYKFFTKLLAGLIFDIVYVAIGKAFFRRRRPNYAPQDDQMVMVGVDKMSFPSGHASRAIYVALLMSDYWFCSFFYLWAGLVSVSRVAYGRHFIGDVIGGALLGYLNWATQSTLFYPVNSLMEYFIMKVLASPRDEF